MSPDRLLLKIVYTIWSVRKMLLKRTEKQSFTSDMLINTFMLTTLDYDL